MRSVLLVAQQTLHHVATHYNHAFFADALTLSKLKGVQRVQPVVCINAARTPKLKL